MDKTLLEWKQLKDHSAKLIEKLKQPSEQTAQMIAANKREQVSPYSTDEFLQSLLASRAPFDELLRRLSIRQALIENIERRRSSKANKFIEIVWRLRLALEERHLTFRSSGARITMTSDTINISRRWR